MNFAEGFLLFLFQGVLLVFVATAIRTMANEVKHLRSIVMEMVADPPARLEAHSDPIVYDAHSDNDQYESVTKRAEREWEAA